ncbi:hypothetical protein ACQP2U_42480 (plasmid) [Nocardia sp. CA-084685]|uniref:hypothetical protein n=1 Tax=Nocardia sp. CA-084685 TaxID=3239970 RepID=UPI003D960CC2
MTTPELTSTPTPWEDVRPSGLSPAPGSLLGEVRRRPEGWIAVRIREDHNKGWQFIGKIPSGPGHRNGIAEDWLLDPGQLVATIPGTPAAAALRIDTHDRSTSTTETGLVTIPDRPGRGFAGGEVRRTPEGWIAVHIGRESRDPWRLIGAPTTAGDRGRAFRHGCATDEAMADAEPLGALPHTPAAMAHLVAPVDPHLARAHHITVIIDPDFAAVARWLDDHHKLDRLQRRSGGRDGYANEILDELHNCGYDLISHHAARSGETEYITSDPTRLPQWAAQHLYPSVFAGGANPATTPQNTTSTVPATTARTLTDPPDALTVLLVHPNPAAPARVEGHQITNPATESAPPVADIGAATAL